MLTRPATEAEMIATFLWRSLIRRGSAGALGSRTRWLNTAYPIGSSGRRTRPTRQRTMLERASSAAYRGWGQWESVFGGLPDDVEWTWPSRTEVTSRSGSSRSSGTSKTTTARVGCPNWHRCRTPTTRTPSPSDSRAGESLASPILIAEPDLERLVILEGHNRLIGYARDVSAVDFPLRAMVGVSSRASEWSEW